MGNWGNGVDGIYREVHEKYVSPSSIVWYLPWDCNVSDLAEFIFRTAAEMREQKPETANRPHVHIAGYSFGGQTAVNLAVEMRKRNFLFVDRLTLCDAVKRRSKGPLGWLSAANPFSAIVIPDNVQEVTVFVQRNPRWRFKSPFFFPSGHRIHNSTAKLNGPFELFSEHAFIDNAQQFRDKVLEDAELIHL